jgi:hypothetical protein
MVQKCRPFLDTLGTSLGLPAGLYLSKQQLIVPTIKLAKFAGGTRPRIDL